MRRKWSIRIVPSVPETSSRRSIPPRNAQLTSNWPTAPFSKRTSPMPWSSASIGCTSVSAQHMTSTGRMRLPMKLRMISTQWQPMSMMAPPPASSGSQNHGLCGPGCVSRERTQSICPSAPSRTAARDFSVFGV